MYVEFMRASQLNLTRYTCMDSILLNQVRAWFLEITFVHNVCVRARVRACMCPSIPEAINN